MSRKQLALFEPSLVAQALMDAVKKLSPHTQWRNPVMFIVWLGSLLTTLLTVAMATNHMQGNPWFTGAISLWLWITVLFANFAEALAEGRSKAQANSLKKSKKPPSPANFANPNTARQWITFLPMIYGKGISCWWKLAILSRVTARSLKVAHQ